MHNLPSSSFFSFGERNRVPAFFVKVYSTVCWKTRCVLLLEGGSRRLGEKSLLGATPLAPFLLSRFVCGCVDGRLGWLRLSKPVVEDNLSARGGKEEGKRRKKEERSIVLGQKEFAKSSPSTKSFFLKRKIPSLAALKSLPSQGERNTFGPFLEFITVSPPSLPRSRFLRVKLLERKGEKEEWGDFIQLIVSPPPPGPPNSHCLFPPLQSAVQSFPVLFVFFFVGGDGGVNKRFDTMGKWKEEEGGAKKSPVINVLPFHSPPYQCPTSPWLG